jgi:putative LysE/RhtB family amino acid efflux pump
VQGLLIGLAVAAPVGPIGVLFIRRTLADGFAAGMAAGTGTALADGLYAAAAGFGLTVAMQTLGTLDLPLRIAGLLFMAWLGVSTFRAVPAAEPAGLTPARAVALGAQTFALTMANPATILSFVAIFAGFGITAAAPADATALVAGTFTGSLLWWLTLGATLTIIRHRLTPQTMVWINRTAGAAMLGFALVLALSLLGI